MKRILFPIAGLLSSVLFMTCQKTRPLETQQPDLIQQAKTYYTDSLSTQPLQPVNPRTSCPRTPQWTGAYTVRISTGNAVVVPIEYSRQLEIRTGFSGSKLFALDDLAHLVIYHDHAGRIQANLITAFPDTSALRSTQANFSGMILVETWNGRPVDQYRFTPNGTIYHTSGTPSTAEGKGHTTTASANPVTPDFNLTSCQQIDGYNYSADDPDDTYSWTESVGCTTIYIPDGPNSNSLSPSDLGRLARPLPNLSPVILGGSNPITDISSYFKCFTNSTAIDHTYSVQVCVSQPVPGSRQAWAVTQGGPIGSISAGNPVNVGHTFLVVTENAAGSIIVRNVGFYPQTSVNPAYPSDQGQLDDNELTGYNVSLTYTVTNAQFYSILTYLSLGNNAGYLYNLSSNNCTTFALHALAAGDVDLSSQQGSWPGGSGYDPGDLGEDIRSMTLPPNASRNTVSGPHPNQGNCN